MAKAPVPGQCMTRLGAELGHTRAVRLYCALVEHVVAQITAQYAPSVTLCCAPSPRHALFQRLARRYDLRLQRQARGSLGRRMHRALADQHSVGGTLLLGVDQPDIDPRLIIRAADGLADSVPAVWFAPTRDGGYWAIAARRAEARLFAGCAWSTGRVARQTRRAAARLRFSIIELPAQRDIDTPRDWAQLAPTLRSTIARRATMPGAAAGRAGICASPNKRSEASLNV